MPLPSLVRREWHVVYQFPLAVGLITALNLAVTVWWDWSGVEGAFAFALNTAWMLLLTVVTVGLLGIVGLPLRFVYRLNDRWRRRWWLAPCGILAGLAMCASSFHIGAEDLCSSQSSLEYGRIVACRILHPAFLYTFRKDNTSDIWQKSLAEKNSQRN